MKQGQVFWQHLPQQQQQQHQKQADMKNMTTITARETKGNKIPRGPLHKCAWVHEVVVVGPLGTSCFGDHS